MTDAVLTEDAELARLRPAAPVSLAALRWSAEALLVLDRLVEVSLTLLGPRSQLDTVDLWAAIRPWLDAPIVRIDEGLWRSEGATTTLVVDLLEGRLTFSDSEAP